MNCNLPLSTPPISSALSRIHSRVEGIHHHQDSSVVYPPFVQLHQTSPAISDSIPPIESDTHLDAVHVDEQDNGLELGYHVILGSLIWVMYWAVGVMKLGMRLWGVGCPPARQL
jgi:hypothetical protein